MTGIDLLTPSTIMSQRAVITRNKFRLKSEQISHEEFQQIATLTKLSRRGHSGLNLLFFVSPLLSIAESKVAGISSISSELDKKKKSFGLALINSLGRVLFCDVGELGP